MEIEPTNFIHDDQVIEELQNIDEKPNSYGNRLVYHSYSTCITDTYNNISFSKILSEQEKSFSEFKSNVVFLSSLENEEKRTQLKNESQMKNEEEIE